MFDLPEGQAPFGLPPEYAAIDWVDAHDGSCAVDRVWSDGVSCSESAFCANEWTNTDCWLDRSSAVWTCDCSSSRVSFPAAAVPTTFGQACRAATAICLTDLPATDTTSCDDSGYSSRDYCAQHRQCSETHASAHGEISKRATQQSAWCSFSDGQTSDCWCGENYQYQYQYQVNVSLPAETSCAVTLDVCSEGMDEGSEGPVECDFGSGSFSSTDCSRTYTCRQPGLSGGVEVTFRRDLYTYCTKVADTGEWQCSCDPSSTQLDNVVAATANEACEAAVGQCVTSILPTSAL